ILYGKNPKNLDSIAFDERDSGGEKEKRVYHFALLRNLDPSTKYYYKIISNNEVIQSEGTDTFSADTLDDSEQATIFSPMYGSVYYSNNEPAGKTLAMLIVGNAHPLIAVSGSTGEWLIPLQYLINKDTSSAVSIGENDPITLQLFNDTQRSMVRSTFERSRPLPESIILGNNYSFIADSNVLSAQDSNPSLKESSQTQVEIRYPKQDAVVPGVAPIIKGYGIPREYVNIHIDSKPEFSARARVDENGEWDIPVKTKILPGTYTLTATTKGKNGKTVQLSRRFTLIKSGEQVLGESNEATPSGTLTPSVNPSGILSLTPKLSVTVIVTTPTPIPPPPVSGLNIVPYVFAGVGFVVLGFGVLLLL
ncbi:MAG: hypothetical protein Q8P72_04910, partial [Candidatus Roizmanbacteria bacterium]|nr:hypothetical protein [Candidatus Roizmanbacteria bacterium]